MNDAWQAADDEYRAWVELEEREIEECAVIEEEEASELAVADHADSA